MDSLTCSQILTTLTIPDVTANAVPATWAFGAVLDILHLLPHLFPHWIAGSLGERLLDSSLTLFQTAALLAPSWNAALIYLLSSVDRTNHTAQAAWLTASSSVLIGLGALFTSRNHKGLQSNWVLVFFLSFPLCLTVNVLAGIRVFGNQIPAEACLPFFQTYQKAIKITFVVQSAFFWLASLAMVWLLIMGPRQLKANTQEPTDTADIEEQNGTARCPDDNGNGNQDNGETPKLLRRWCAPAVLAILFLQIILFILIFHGFVPEQELRKEANHQLEEERFSFGQLLTLFMWASVAVQLCWSTKAETTVRDCATRIRGLALRKK